jgi:hypothetical protein
MSDQENVAALRETADTLAEAVRQLRALADRLEPPTATVRPDATVLISDADTIAAFIHNAGGSARRADIRAYASAHHIGAARETAALALLADTGRVEHSNRGEYRETDRTDALSARKPAAQTTRCANRATRPDSDTATEDSPIPATRFASTATHKLSEHDFRQQAPVPERLNEPDGHDERPVANRAGAPNTTTKRHTAEHDELSPIDTNAREDDKPQSPQKQAQSGSRAFEQIADLGSTPRPGSPFDPWADFS